MPSHLIGDVVFFGFARRTKGLRYNRVSYVGIRGIEQLIELLKFIDEPDNFCGEANGMAMYSLLF